VESSARRRTQKPPLGGLCEPSVRYCTTMRSISSIIVALALWLPLSVSASSVLYAQPVSSVSGSVDLKWDESPGAISWSLYDPLSVGVQQVTSVVMDFGSVGLEAGLYVLFECGSNLESYTFYLEHDYVGINEFIMPGLCEVDQSAVLWVTIYPGAYDPDYRMVGIRGVPGMGQLGLNPYVKVYGTGENVRYVDIVSPVNGQVIPAPGDTPVDIRVTGARVTDSESLFVQVQSVQGVGSTSEMIYQRYTYDDSSGLSGSSFDIVSPFVLENGRYAVQACLFEEGVELLGSLCDRVEIEVGELPSCTYEEDLLGLCDHGNTEIAANGTTTIARAPHCQLDSERFDISMCVGELLMPTAVEMQTAWNKVLAAASTAWPLGYVISVWGLFDEDYQYAMAFESGSTTVQQVLYSTSTLPDLILTVPTGLPMAGASLDLTPWDKVKFSEWRITGHETTWWQEVDQYWNWGWRLMFGLLVVMRVMSFWGRSINVMGRDVAVSSRVRVRQQ